MSDVFKTIASGIDEAGRRMGLSAEIRRVMTDSVQELVAIEHGGGEVHVAALSSVRRKERNASVIKCWDGGMSAKKNWELHKIGRSTYYEIINSELARRRQDSTRRTA